MNVVIDTNVIVSAVLRKGLPLAVVEATILTPGLRWIVSSEIYAEYIRILSHPRLKVSPNDLDDWKLLIERATHTIRTDAGQEFRAIRDPNDVMFLQCASQGGATYLVSGDRDLLALRELVPFRIFTPTEFIESISASNPGEIP